MKLSKKIGLLWCYFRIYASAFSWRRVFNVLFLAVSFLWSKWRRKAIIIGRPLAFSFEPINVCNLKCPECPTGMLSLDRPKGVASVLEFEKVVRKMKSYSWLVNLYFQGEPLMHPDFSSMIRSAKSGRLITTTSTNGHYLNKMQAKKMVESGLDILIVSLDGRSQESYQKYRVGGDLNVVLKGIANLVEEKKNQNSFRPLIIAQFLVFRHNEQELNGFEKWALDLGVNQVQVKSAQIYNVKEKVQMLPSNKSLSRYAVNSGGEVALKGRYKNSCWKQWSTCVYTWNGFFVPCCFDKDAKYQIGNIFHSNVKELWQKDAIKRFRNKVLNDQKNIDICKNCPVAKK